jgi:SAM-dependent methyltransferase
MTDNVERFFSQHVTDFTHRLAEFERRLHDHDEPHDDDALADLAECMTHSLDVCAQLESRIEHNPQLLKETQVRYREAIWPWLGKSWFMDRSFTKPRGYPGDFELLQSIYDRAPKARGLGGYLDRYILASTLGRAVVFRLKSIREFLEREVARRGGKANILNVACGPGREYINDFLAAEAVDVRITCVDNDTAALDYVRDNVAPLTNSRVDLRFMRYNALRMISGKANIERFGRSDIIYSVGLCDYIPDDYLVPMLRGWRESLAEGGLVYVAFKDQELYDKAVYQWLMDWYFYQRTYEDCRRLFVEAGYDMEELEVTRSDMAVIINFIGRTKGGSYRRIDDAEQLTAPVHIDGAAEHLPNIVEESGS